MYLDLVRDCLQPQELVEAPAAVEAAPPAHLGASVREIGLVVDGHGIDVYSAILVSSLFQLLGLEGGSKGDVPALDLLRDA